jgi:hypothetical protein
VRSDGQTAWVYLLVSLLRDTEDGPGLHLTMVEDVSDLHLLQGRVSFQSLHDALTGLPNRQHLLSRLEGMLGERVQTGPNRQHVALYLLDLDGFSVINNGPGCSRTWPSGWNHCSRRTAWKATTPWWPGSPATSSRC